MKVLILFLFFSFSFVAQSQVRVAFYEGYDHKGQQIVLSQGERFFHTAIQIEGIWYQVTGGFPVGPFNFKKKNKALRLISVLENPFVNLTYQDILPYLGLPFDYSYSWGPTKSSYCSKLVANLLHVQPSPMVVDSSIWEGEHKRKPLKGAPGLSPDELYEKLIKRGFYETESTTKPKVGLTKKSCASLLSFR